MEKNFNNSLDVRRLTNVQLMLKDNGITVKKMVEGFQDTLHITLAMIAMVMRAASAVTLKYVWGWSVMFDVSESFVLNHNEGLCIGVYDEAGEHYMIDFETYRYLLFFGKLQELTVLENQPLTEEDTASYPGVDFKGKTILKVHRVALKNDIHYESLKYFGREEAKFSDKNQNDRKA